MVHSKMRIATLLVCTSLVSAFSGGVLFDHDQIEARLGWLSSGRYYHEVTLILLSIFGVYGIIRLVTLLRRL